MLKHFVGKTVIITGASSGIGAATAVEFAKCKAKCVLSGRKFDQLQLVKKQCIESGLKDNEINNAGLLYMNDEPQVKMTDFDKTHQVNLRAHVAITMLTLPHLFKSKGNVVNVSSVLGRVPGTGFMSYCIAKAGMDMFTKALAFELATTGVRVNSVNPAVVPTNIYREKKIFVDNNDFWNKTEKLHPVQRNGKTHEVVDAIMFLASNQASFITGELLGVDGGVSIGGVKL